MTDPVSVYQVRVSMHVVARLHAYKNSVNKTATSVANGIAGFVSYLSTSAATAIQDSIGKGVSDKKIQLADALSDYTVLLAETPVGNSLFTRELQDAVLRLGCILQSGGTNSHRAHAIYLEERAKFGPERKVEAAQNFFQRLKSEFSWPLTQAAAHADDDKFRGGALNALLSRLGAEISCIETSLKASKRLGVSLADISRSFLASDEFVIVCYHLTNYILHWQLHALKTMLDAAEQSQGSAAPTPVPSIFSTALARVSNLRATVKEAVRDPELTSEKISTAQLKLDALDKRFPDNPNDIKTVALTLLSELKASQTELHDAHETNWEIPMHLWIYAKIPLAIPPSDGQLSSAMKKARTAIDALNVNDRALFEAKDKLADVPQAPPQTTTMWQKAAAQSTVVPPTALTTAGTPPSASEPAAILQRAQQQLAAAQQLTDAVQQLPVASQQLPGSPQQLPDVPLQAGNAGNDGATSGQQQQSQATPTPVAKLEP